MIFLIEDKKTRRCDYGWSDSQLASHSVVLISDMESFRSNMDAMRSSDSVVLYHESFAGSTILSSYNDITDFIEELKSSNVKIALFSGSKSTRSVDSNVCNIPPSILYVNLKSFITHYNSGDIDFKYLMFGNAPELEEKLHEELRKVNRENFSKAKYETEKKLLFYTTLDENESLDVPFTNAIVNDGLELLDDCEDESLCVKIDEDLVEEKYDCIFIPVCFGDTLSDFLGLRMAMLIRLSQNKNTKTPIVLYGQAPMHALLTNECFDILKNPGVRYVNADYSAIINAANNIKDVSDDEYAIGIKNIHLNVPTDIGDNHSVSNKWAIYRWSHVLDDVDSGINGIRQKVNASLYFRYLSALYPTSVNKVSKERFRINNESNAKLKVLLVDDEADEGWYELLCEILYDINDVDFCYIGQEIKNKSRDEIENIVMEKVKKEEPNIVILDFRLHSDDYECKDIEQISGCRILSMIKKRNRGIQVLIFSATNKVWNFQELQNREADGFILKESPENSKEPLFTLNVMQGFVSAISTCSNNIYKIDVWNKIQELSNHVGRLQKCKTSNSTYVNAVKNLLDMAEDAIFSKDSKYPEVSAFMNFFRILEATSNELFLESESRAWAKFKVSDEPLLRFGDDGIPTPRGGKDKIRMFDKICNMIYSLNLSIPHYTKILADKRNNFTHPNLTQQGSRLEVFSAQDVVNSCKLVYDIIINRDHI